MASKKHILLLFIIFLASSFFAHYPSIKGEFLWDDYTLITNNPKIQKLNVSNLSYFFKNTYFSNPNYPSGKNETSGYYRPVANIAYALFFKLFQKNYEYWHMANIFLHSINALLIFILFWKLTSNFTLSALISFLFVLHPFYHQIVDYCTGMVDIFSLMFGLFSMIFLHIWIKSQRYFQASGFFFILAYLLALFTKENTMLAPAIIISFTIFKKNKITADILKKTITFSCLFIFYFWIRKYFIGLSINIKPLSPSLIIYYSGVIKLLLQNIYRVLLPSSATFLQQYFHLKSAITFEVILGGFLFGVLSIYTFKKNKDLFVLFFLFFVLSIIPVSNVIPIHPDISDVALYHSDHLLYFPSIALFAFLSAAILSFFSHSKFIKVISSILILMYASFFLFHSQKNSRVWGNPEKLYKTVYTQNSTNISAILQLGIYYNLKNRPQDALKEYDKLISIIKVNDEILDPSLYAKCLTNRAYSSLQLKDFQKAKESYEKAAQYSPENFMNYFGLGMALKKSGNTIGAKQAFNKTLKINPGYKPAIKELEKLK